jgi:protease-4
MIPWALSFGRWMFTLTIPLRALRAKRLVHRGDLVSLTLDGPLVEHAEKARFWQRRLQRTSLQQIRALVDAIVRDPQVKGLLLELKSLKAGASTATSLRQILQRLGRAQKLLVVHLPMGGGSREMLLASAADRVIVGPQATISPLGVAVETRYFRRVLDKVGVLPEIFARGEFKTAGESLARDSMSSAQREQLGALLDVLENELIDAIASGRRLALPEVRALVDGGPYRARDAVQRGLVDAVGYDDELPTLADVNVKKPATLVSAAAYLAVKRKWPSPKRVGVVHVAGPIVSRAPFAFSRMAVDERVIGALRVARESSRIEGVVVVIDSPGGSVLASDRIYHELTRVAEKKPVVAYFANVAASGGYYIGAGAHAIVAQPTTVTGSIGVVAAHLVLSPLLAKLGVVTELVKRGARADMLSSSRPLDPGEREAMTHEIEGFYRDFVDIVARSRKRTAEEIEPLARGRVYSGLDAHRLGLVDRLGDFDTAVDIVRERLGETRELTPWVIKPPRITPKPPAAPVPFVDALLSIAGPQAADLLTLACAAAPTEFVLAYCSWDIDKVGTRL